ncbi:MAG: DUF362 domain-containing protein [Elusimicrobiales bacterium]|nr:DUF362 domain-containing protein [Elusimicrobiales bacterium]
MKRNLLLAAAWAALCVAGFRGLSGAAKTPESKIPEVYFSSEISAEKVKAAYNRLGFKPAGKVGVKVHFGEDGNENYLPPALLKALVTGLKGSFVETNTLYGGSRADSKTHIATAKKHGWGYAPIDILDTDGETALPYKGKYFTKVYVGKGMAKYGSFLVISHFKGHGGAGFGGALKNLAMGFGSPTGKKAQHQGQFPTITKKCNKCGICPRTCPVGAISADFVIDRTKCIGCGKCVEVCPIGAIDSAPAATKGVAFQEKIAEYAQGVTAGGKFTYINLLMNISAACDCRAGAPAPFMGDVGILASNDPVALDQASFDLVNKAAGLDDAFKHETGVSGVRALEYAQAIGLGSRRYKLVEIK